MSGFAAVSSLGIIGLAAELSAAPVGTLLPGTLDILVAPAAAIGVFDPGFALDADFGVELFGLATADAVAGFTPPAATCELAAGTVPCLGIVDANLGVADAGLAAAGVGVLVTEVRGLGSAVAGEAGAFAAEGCAGLTGFAGAA